MDNDVEVIFESWFYKLRGDDPRQFAHVGGAWRRKYFVLIRDCNKPCLLYYTKKPRSSNDVPRGAISLSEHYRVERKPKLKGKELVCQLTTQSRTLFLATDKEHVHHLLMFFLTTQIRLKDHLEAECFVVRPDNSEDHRQIGSRGAMCLLHVSNWGLTLALQVSRCVLAQWPFRCIRSYECTGRGRFTLETGSHATHGAGSFVLHTRAGHDGILYDKIDTLVSELASLHGMVSARVSNTSLSNIESVATDYQGLAQLTTVCSDAASISQLKRISRDIFDHLAEHLGSPTTQVSSSIAVSLADMASTVNASPQLPPSRAPAHLPQRKETVSPDTMTSQYLHVTETEETSHAEPPRAVFSAKSTAAARLSDEVKLDRMYSVETNTSATSSELGATSSEAADHPYVNDAERKTSRPQHGSADDLSHYQRMSGDSARSTTHSYVNNGANAGVYSYARTFDLSLRLSDGTSSPSVQNGSVRKLAKTSSSPTLLDADRPGSLSAQSRAVASGRDDYVPASPPSAAISIKSGSELGASSTVSDPFSSPTGSDTASPVAIGNASPAVAVGNASPAVLSPVAGISMSKRSRVFTRQK